MSVALCLIGDVSHVNNRDVNDLGAIWPPNEILNDVVNKIQIRVFSCTSTSFTIYCWYVCAWQAANTCDAWSAIDKLTVKTS